MPTHKQPLFPPYLLVLDFFGFVFLGLGVAKLFGAIDVIPVDFRFQGYGVIFVVLGIVLMAPTFIRVITNTRK